MDQPNLYTEGDIVWVTDSACHAKVLKVFRPLGDAHYRYDIECDDGGVLQYVEEDRLYPSNLSPLDTYGRRGENAQAIKGKGVGHA